MSKKSICLNVKICYTFPKNWFIKMKIFLLIVRRRKKFNYNYLKWSNNICINASTILRSTYLYFKNDKYLMFMVDNSNKKICVDYCEVFLHSLRCYPYTINFCFSFLERFLYWPCPYCCFFKFSFFRKPLIPFTSLFWQSFFVFW